MTREQQTGMSRKQAGRSVSVRLAVTSGLLLGVVLLSAFGTIYSTHACRELYASLQVLEHAQWYLQEDYGRLLLEQSTQASHYRVEKIARSELDMIAPRAAQFKVVSR